MIRTRHHSRPGQQHEPVSLAWHAMPIVVAGVIAALTLLAGSIGGPARGTAGADYAQKKPQAEAPAVQQAQGSGAGERATSLLVTAAVVPGAPR